MANFKNASYVLALTAILVPGLAFAAPARPPVISNVMPGAAQARAATAGGGTANHGHFVCTAAITASGSVFSGEYVNAAQTMHLGTGIYQVGFTAPCPDVRIALGWYRICQRDTLADGVLPAGSCIVADRAGTAAAIWVETFDAAGNLADSPFTLHVSR